jgi:hypothetical protein
MASTSSLTSAISATISGTWLPVRKRLLKHWNAVGEPVEAGTSVNLLQHKLRDRSVDVHKKPPDQPARLGFACGFSGTTGCGPGGCTPGGIGRYPRERIGFPVLDQAKTA